jgi:hypothetical protein
MLRLSFLLVILISSACFEQSAGIIGDGHYTAGPGMMGARVRSVRMLHNGKSRVVIFGLEDNQNHLRQIAVLLAVPTDIGKLRSQFDGQYILLERNIHQHKKQGLKCYKESDIILAPDADKVVDIEPL